MDPMPIVESADRAECAIQIPACMVTVVRPACAGKTVYGTLWFGKKLPLDGVAVEWTYMYPDLVGAHDMNCPRMPLHISS